MTIAEYLAAGRDPNKLKGCIGLFTRQSRGVAETAAGRIETVSDGTVSVRYNGVRENDWYFPRQLPTTEVTLQLDQDGNPTAYDSRPLTQR
jgi:hypothetical protein